MCDIHKKKMSFGNFSATNHVGYLKPAFFVLRCLFFMFMCELFAELAVFCRSGWLYGGG